VKEFLLEVNAEVALLLWAEELSGAHGEDGVGNSSWTDEGLLRPNLNPPKPSFDFAASVVDFSLLPPCFLVKSPMSFVHGDRNVLEKSEPRRGQQYMGRLHNWD
jgi:hypothetical protein